jgi:hypothetical protein
MAANKSSPIVRRARPRMPSAQSHTKNTPQIRDSVISFNLIFKSESLLMRYQENLSQNMITKTLGTIRRVLASKIFDCCIEGLPPHQTALLLFPPLPTRVEKICLHGGAPRSPCSIRSTARSANCIGGCGNERNAVLTEPFGVEKVGPPLELPGVV